MANAKGFTNSPLLGNIQKLYQSNEAAKVLLDYFSKRKRKTKETNVSSILTDLPRAGFPQSFPPEDIAYVLEALGEYGCGEVMRDPANPRNTKLMWYPTVSMQDIGTKSKNKDFLDIDTSPEDSSTASKLIQHDFQIRKNLKITITLPEDMTRSEADRLSKFISALPFE